MRIDSHHHLWNYSASEYGWIDEQMGVLRRDFTPKDLHAVTAAAAIDGVISVQARQTLQETEWLLQTASVHDLIRGVVGWVPLASPSIDSELSRLCAHPKLKGVRHVVQSEPDDNFILGSDFNRGIERLLDTGLVYDILIFAKHLKPTIEFVDRHPNQVFVLDHIAKPTIDERFDETWAVEMKDLARRPNVSCKFSGVVTEVRGAEWTNATIKPYWDVAMDAFGPQRLMFGSDWPVCLLKSDYARWIATVEQFTGNLSTAEQEAFWGGNATRVYQL